MENIWGFLVQTLSVSLVAALLLLIKRIFADKLSPRWQYGIWSLLALRILLPVGVKRYIILPLPLWLETIKGWVEETLTSAYSGVYVPIRIRHVLPEIQGMPISVTDCLLVVYAAGIVITLLWYLCSYLRLRMLLRKGVPASAELTARIRSVAEQYGLEDCPAVAIHGLPSAFVCGVIRPILAVPASTELDDKVILHELLHLKHKDALQSVFWCVLRALHWCNPFLQYVFYWIANDMESLCDQRVLERLEGEARREYGAILLNMANERYARVPGTTSISNGGKNISRRIAAIVRFKKYPKGMSLVSICIGIMLISPILMGTERAYAADLFSPGPIRELDQSMAMARLNRCTTVAGALDTYAKGLILNNGVYIAAASSLSKHESLEAEMRRFSLEESWVAYYLYSGEEFETIDSDEGYSIWNLTENPDGSKSALLAFPVKYFAGTESEERYLEDMKQSLVTENVTLLIPVTVSQEDGAWIVEETGERICSDQYYEDCDSGYFEGEGYSPVPPQQQYTQTGEWGTILLERKVKYTVENRITETSFWGSTSSFDLQPKLDAEFEETRPGIFTKYRCVDNYQEVGPKESYGWQIQSQSEDGSWETMFVSSQQPVLEDWDGIVMRAGASGLYIPDEVPVALPEAYRVTIFWDAKVVGEVILQEETDGTE